MRFWIKSRVRIVRQEYSYSFFAFLAELGGYLGLFMGMSTYSLFSLLRYKIPEVEAEEIPDSWIFEPWHPHSFRNCGRNFPSDEYSQSFCNALCECGRDKNVKHLDGWVLLDCHAKSRAHDFLQGEQAKFATAENIHSLCCPKKMFSFVNCAHFRLMMNRAEKSFKANRLAYLGRRLFAKVLLAAGVCLVAYEIFKCAEKLMETQVGIRLLMEHNLMPNFCLMSI